MKKSKKVIESLFGKPTVGSMIRTYRFSHEISRKELSQKLKIKKSKLTNIENHKTRLTLSETIKVAKKLDEAPHLYAKVWCEEELGKVGIDFEDLTKIV